METFLWAHDAFWGADLGDIRLQRRLVEMAWCIRENPRGTLPQALREPKELKAAYRFLSNPKVTHRNIIAPHVKAVREKCRAPGDCLIIEDTTALSFSQRDNVAGMGQLTHEGTQGMLAHTSLAVRIAHWSEGGFPEVVLEGVFGQQCWVREQPQGTRVQRKRVKRAEKREGVDNSEAARWGRMLQEAGPPPKDARWTLVADRECDIFHVLHQCAQEGHDWVIRASQARRTTGEADNVFDAAAQGRLLGAFTLPLRSRPGAAAREACVEVRAAHTEILAPRGLGRGFPPQATTLVEVRESDPPEGVTPLHWVLLSSWPCADLAAARRVIGAYTARWLIEEYHKALKTGTHIEDSQLASGAGIEALLAIHAVVAADLLQMKLLAKTKPEEPVEPELLAPEALKVLELQMGRPPQGWTTHQRCAPSHAWGDTSAEKTTGHPAGSASGAGGCAYSS
jgi:hypothetical protein